MPHTGKRAREETEDECDDEYHEHDTELDSTLHRHNGQQLPPAPPVWELQVEAIALCSGRGLYQYPPLADYSKQMRLLKFSDSPGDVSVAIQMSVFDRGDAPDYIAISYTWGEKRFKPICIDGENALVRESCHALEQVKNHWPNIYVWIDVLCIDQTDLQEKNMQVASMFTTYSKALGVAACLGTHHNESEWMIEVVNVLENMFNGLMQTHGIVGWQDWDLRDDMVIGNNVWHHLFAAFGDADILRLWRALIAFASREYWRRAWIIQEIVASGPHTEAQVGRSGFILCGDCRAPLTSVHMTMEVLRLYFDGRPSLQDEVRRINRSSPHGLNMSYMMRRTMTDDEMVEPFATAVEYSLEYNCLDPRDRIYSQLQIVKWGDLEPLEPDYTITAWNLAVAAASRLALDDVQNSLQALRITHDLAEMKEDLHRRSETQPTHGLAPYSYDLITYTERDLMCSSLQAALEGPGLKAVLRPSTRQHNEIWSFADATRNLQESGFGPEDFVPLWCKSSNREQSDAFAGLLHRNTRDGDVIVQFGLPGDGHLLVMRESTAEIASSTARSYDVVGQGVLCNGYRLLAVDGHLDEGTTGKCDCGVFNLMSSSRHVVMELRATALDAVVLMGQDLASVENSQLAKIVFNWHVFVDYLLGHLRRLNAQLLSPHVMRA